MENRSRADSSDIAFRKIFIGGLSYSTDEEKLEKYFSSYGAVQDAVVMKDPVSKRSRGFGFITFYDINSVDNTLANEPHTIDSRKVEAKRAVPRSEMSRDSSVPSKQQSSPTDVHSPSHTGSTLKSIASPQQLGTASPLMSANSSSANLSSYGSSPSLMMFENHTMDPKINMEEYAYNKIFVGGLHYDTRDGEFRAYFERFGKVISAEVMFNRETHKSRGFGFVVYESEQGALRVCAEKEHVIDGKVVEVKRAIPRSKIPSSSPLIGGKSVGLLASPALSNPRDNVRRTYSVGSASGLAASNMSILNSASSHQQKFASLTGRKPLSTPPNSKMPFVGQRGVNSASYAAALKLGGSSTDEMAGLGLSAGYSPSFLGLSGGNNGLPSLLYQQPSQSSRIRAQSDSIVDNRGAMRGDLLSSGIDFSSSLFRSTAPVTSIQHQQAGSTRSSRSNSAIGSNLVSSQPASLLGGGVSSYMSEESLSTTGGQGVAYSSAEKLAMLRSMSPPASGTTLSSTQDATTPTLNGISWLSSPPSNPWESTLEYDLLGPSAGRPAPGPLSLELPPASGLSNMNMNSFPSGDPVSSNTTRESPNAEAPKDSIFSSLQTMSGSTDGLYSTMSPPQQMNIQQGLDSPGNVLSKDTWDALVSSQRQQQQLQQYQQQQQHYQQQQQLFQQQLFQQQFQHENIQYYTLPDPPPPQQQHQTQSLTSLQQQQQQQQFYFLAGQPSQGPSQQQMQNQHQHFLDSSCVFRDNQSSLQPQITHLADGLFTKQTESSENDELMYELGSLGDYEASPVTLGGMEH